MNATCTVGGRHLPETLDLDAAQLADAWAAETLQSLKTAKNPGRHIRRKASIQAACWLYSAANCRCPLGPKIIELICYLLTGEDNPWVLDSEPELINKAAVLFVQNPQATNVEIGHKLGCTKKR